MIIKDIYQKIFNNLSRIDFESIWPGFHPYEFALYDDETVYFKDRTIKRDNRFIGNTAILFDNKYIAIWYLDDTENVDIDRLTSTICHEMFHAFQYDNKEKRFIREVLAVINYHYSSGNLSLKYQENELLVSLLDEFDQDRFYQLLQIKKYRTEKFAFEFLYESRIEVIEGMAFYVEMMVLKQLNEEKYLKSLIKRKEYILNRKTLLPIRLHCYYSGCLLMLLCKENNLDVNHIIGKETKDIATLLLDRNTVEPILKIEIDPEVKRFVEGYIKSIKDLIGEKISKSKPCEITPEKSKLAGFDPYNAKFIDRYVYCPGFIAFGTDESNLKFEMGNYIVKLDKDVSVKELYKE